MARPTKLTAKLVDDMAELLAACPILSAAAGKLEITYQSIYNWCRLGEREAFRRESGRIAQEKYHLHVRFFYAIKRAHADFQTTWLPRLMKGHPGWTSIAWTYERLWPEFFGGLQQQLRDQERRLARLEKDRDRQ